MGLITLMRTCNACRRLIFIPLVLLALASCLDFQFESEYEDINGIYVEHISSYDYFGTKLLFNGSTGYISHDDSLLVYDFTELDSVVYLGHYIAADLINDFQIFDDHAILGTDQSIEIIDLHDSMPVQLSSMSVLFYNSSIRVHNDNAFVAHGHHLHVIDISDVQQPTLMSSLDFEEDIRQVEIDSIFAYTLVGTDFLVLNIENPGALYVEASTSLPASGITNPEAFIKRNDFFYFSGYTLYNALLSACTLSAHSDLRLLDQIVIPDRTHQLHISSEYTLAVSWFQAYLLNLQYPSSPCIGELIERSGGYGIIYGNYIHFLTPALEIFEIKQAE